MNEKINDITKSTKLADSKRVAVDSANITLILYIVCNEFPVNVK
jgi:hypothetical protein